MKSFKVGKFSFFPSGKVANLGKIKGFLRVAFVFFGMKKSKGPNIFNLFSSFFNKGR